MRVIIVEDRFLARDELKYLLSLFPDVEVVGEFEDTVSAWPHITAGNIDGVFLDIDFETEGRRAGLDLAYRIDRLTMITAPWVVFITGFDEYALEAHLVRPFGYLMKPLNQNRLSQVMEKIRKSEEQSLTPKSKTTRIEIKHKIIGHDKAVWCTKYIDPNEILYIQTNNNSNSVKIQLVRGEVLDGIQIALNKWKIDFNLTNFLQIHRSHLVNLNYVNGYKPDPFRIDAYSVTFRTCSLELAVGKNHLEDLRKALARN